MYTLSRALLFVVACWPAFASCRVPDASSSSASSAADESELWRVFRTPGDEHKALAGKIGTWNITVRSFAPDGATAVESQARSVVRWILDGRYVEEVTTGTTMGEAFTGQGWTGFDKLKQRYVWNWIDNFGTGVTSGEGTYDANTRAFESISQTPDLVARCYRATRNVEQEVDRDHRLVRMYQVDGRGREVLMMELAYTRAR